MCTARFSKGKMAEQKQFGERERERETERQREKERESERERKREHSENRIHETNYNLLFTINCDWWILTFWKTSYIGIIVLV